MPQELYASLRIELSEEPATAAGQLAEVTAAWAEMMRRISAEMTVVQAISVNESRNKGVRKHRKQAPRLVEQPPPTAA